MPRDYWTHISKSPDEFHAPTKPYVLNLTGKPAERFRTLTDAKVRAEQLLAPERVTWERRGDNEWWPV